MNPECDRYLADWDLAILGSLDDGEIQAMERHLKTGCVRCQARFLQARQALAGVAELSEQHMPSEFAEQRLRRRIAGARPRRVRAIVPWLAAAASVAGVIWLGMDRGRLLERLDQAERHLASLKSRNPGPAHESKPAAAPSAKPAREVVVIREPAPVARPSREPELEARIGELQRELEELARLKADTDFRNVELREALAAVSNQVRNLERDLAEARSRRVLAQAPKPDAETAALTRRVALLEAEKERQSAQLGDLRRVLHLLESNSLRQVELRRSDPQAQQAWARALVSEDGSALVVARQLPKLPPDKCYQLWIIKKSNPPIVSGGLVATDGSGGGVVYVPPSPDANRFTAFAITDEPAGGSVVARGRKLLFGAI